MDYEKIAKQFGGTTEQPKVDYAVLAKQFGGKELKEEIDVKKPLGQRVLDVKSGLEKGFIKGIGSTLLGASELGEKILLRPIDKLLGFEETKTGVESLGLRKYVESKGTFEKIGFGVEQILEFFVPSSKLAKLEKGIPLIKKMAIEASTLGAQVAIQQGDIDKESRDAVILGALFPPVGLGLNKIISSIPNRKELGTRFINSLIKPLQKDFSYGKNPGRGVAEEGIIANSLDELEQTISTKRDKVGKELSLLGETIQAQAPQLRLDVTPYLKPLDDAADLATRQNNKTLLKRLNEIQQALTNNLIREARPEGDAIVSIGERDLKNLTLGDTVKFKTEIGGLTKWTGNLSDDQSVNKALKQVYGKIKENITQKAKSVNPLLGNQIEKMNERYADLLSAEIATKYREKLIQRQDLISLKQYTFGIGGALFTMLASGGNAIPSVLAGLTGTVLDKALSTPAVKTRLARWLALSSVVEKQSIFSKIPALRDSMERVFGPKIEKQLKRDFKTQTRDFEAPVGFSETQMENYLTKQIEKESIKQEFNGGLESQYQNFVNLLQDSRLKNPKARENVVNGDLETMRKYLTEKGIMSSRDIDDMVYTQEMKSDDILTLFKERLEKENPNLLMGKKVAKNLGYKEPIFAVAPFTITPVFVKKEDELKKEAQKVNQSRVPTYVLQAIMAQESSMGTNKKNEKLDAGKYGWLTGFTKVATSELDRNKIKYNLDTPLGALDATAKFINLKMDLRNKGKVYKTYTDWVKFYNERYNAGASPKNKFKEWLNYYKSK